MFFTIMAKNLKSSHRNISFLKNKLQTKCTLTYLQGTLFSRVINEKNSVLTFMCKQCRYQSLKQKYFGANILTGHPS